MNVPKSALHAPALLAMALIMPFAARAQTTPQPAATDDEVIRLTPFEVVSENKGYYEANTMSGTRLNSKLQDLGASISVVTKEQMADFALLDMNDVFNYEANTEGTGNYTAFVFNRNGEPESATQLEPETANRIRGVGMANTTLGNFETSGRVPFDPLNIDAVEISRGPNSSIFGIGQVAGNVNAVPAAANLTRNRSQIAGRVDSFDGYRTSIDLNRVLKKGVLAARGSAAYQRDGFDLKPSGLDTVRLNGMVRYKPFSKTVISGSYSTYRMHGNRPNVTPPRENISDWISQGSPTWDPMTRTVKKNGVVVGTFPTSIPSYFTISPQNPFFNAFVDQGRIGYLGTAQTTLSTDPNVNHLPNNDPRAGRLVNPIYDTTGIRAAQPLFAKVPSATDKAIYDWSSMNFAAANRIEDRAETTMVTVDQVILDTPRQLLAGQLGYFRENTERYQRNSIGATSNVSTIQGLTIDVNERLLDGTPNPYFLRPFYGATTPLSSVYPTDREISRVQLAYKLDLTHEKNWMRWLGMHTVTAYGEYKDISARQIQSYEAIVDQHSWMGPGVAHAGRGGRIGGLPLPGPNIALGYFRYYLGDNRGYNVDYGPSQFADGRYNFVYGNPVSGFVNESVDIGPAVFGAGTWMSSHTLMKSRGAILQSHLLHDRVVTTFGIRRDQRFTKTGRNLKLNPDGVTLDYSSYDGFADGDWDMGKGPTRTAGIVVKPLPWLSLFANKSDSFQPAPVNQNLFHEIITDPSGKGEDYGFALNLFSGKLFIKVNQYKTVSLDRRDSPSQSMANRVRNIDFNYNYSLQKKAEEWVTADATARGITLTPDEALQKVSSIVGLPAEYLVPLRYENNAVEDLEAKGNEVEVHYNPTNYWTLKMNVTRQEAIAKNLAPEVNRWIAERTAVWEKVIDPLTGEPWFTHRYVSGQSPKDYLDQYVIAPLKLAQALEGKSQPQVRKYRVNLMSNFRLSGITDHKYLKRFNVGGAIRWEDKGAIGYYGKQTLPAIITEYDGSRPIYDKAHLNVDFFVGYRTRFFSDKVTATWQLNVRDLTENGHLQPIAADPDGRFNAYRIVPPRQFILSASFDL